jgi:hypothetical protein
MVVLMTGQFGCFLRAGNQQPGFAGLEAKAGLWEKSQKKT